MAQVLALSGYNNCFYPEGSVMERVPFWRLRTCTYKSLPCHWSSCNYLAVSSNCKRYRKIFRHHHTPLKGLGRFIILFFYLVYTCNKKSSFIYSVLPWGNFKHFCYTSSCKIKRQYFKADKWLKLPEVPVHPSQDKINQTIVVASSSCCTL